MELASAAVYTPVSSAHKAVAIWSVIQDHHLHLTHHHLAIINHLQITIMEDIIHLILGLSHIPTMLPTTNPNLHCSDYWPIDGLFTVLWCCLFFRLLLKVKAIGKNNQLSSWGKLLLFVSVKDALVEIEAIFIVLFINVCRYLSNNILWLFSLFLEKRFKGIIVIVSLAALTLFIIIQFPSR